MLIEFRVENFRSIRDEQVLSMVADNGAEHRDTHTFDSSIAKVGRLVASAAIYGPNAAGKTNLLKALQFMQSVVVGSATAVPTSPSPYTPFKFDLLKREAPSRFEVTFADSETRQRYVYSFSLDAERIHEERLDEHHELKPRPNLLFERTYDPAKGDYKWTFGKSFKGNRTIWRDATRPNALFLSTAVQLNSTQLLPVFRWFEKRLVPIVGVTQFNATLTLKLLNEPGGKERLLPFIRQADFGIADVEVQREPLRSEHFQASLPFGLPFLESNSNPHEPPLHAKVSFAHRRDDPVQIDFFDESNGTQALFRNAGAWLNVFKNAEVLLVDEIDTSLHPVLVEYLISLFHSPKTNPCKAQLLFTTHNVMLLNQATFRRDQIWFVEKGEDFASKCYPLTDFSPRTDEVLAKWYMRGRYGALPILNGLEM